MLDMKFEKTLEALWGNHIASGSFFELVAERPAVNGAPRGISLAHRFRTAANDVAGELDMLDYNYFDLLREKGYMPGFTLPKPANDNARRAAA